MTGEPMTDTALSIRKLGVSFSTPDGALPAVNDFSLDLAPGECVGVVGESGAGKSQSFLAVMGLLAGNASVRGSATLQGRPLIEDGRMVDAMQLNALRGARIAMIFQDPMTSLTPHLKVGEQIAESVIHHLGMSREAARRRALELLQQVQVTDAERRLDQYPHELSGGMRQRVMIAIALITHDLGVVAGIADHVVVMYAGRVVETGRVREILKTPRHPYTQALLASMPRLDEPGGRARNH